MAKQNDEGQVTLDGSVEAVDEKNGEKQVRQMEKSTLQQLKECKQVPIHVPNDPMNDDDNVVVVGINGVFWPIKRGEEVMVPEPVYQVYQDSYKRTREVEKRMNSTDKEVK